MTIAEVKRTRPRSKPVYYPSGDGKPMAETSIHVAAILGCLGALQLRFAGRNDVFFTGNSFIYYEEGNPYKRVAPDCYVVLGVDSSHRRSYKVWEEGGKYPDLVVEVTSKQTKKQDTDFKRELYESWGVQEYIQFDPLGDYLKPPLQGLRLTNGKYVPIPTQDNRLYSEILGLTFVAVGSLLRLFDPIQDAFLPTIVESAEQAIEALRQTKAARQRADAAKLLADEEKRRADATQRLADEEKQRADAAKLQAEEEKQRADAAQRLADEEKAKAEAAARRAEAAEEENRRLREALAAVLQQAEQNRESPEPDEGAA